MLGGWWSGGYQNDRQGTGDGPIFLYENITIKKQTLFLAYRFNN